MWFAASEILVGPYPLNEWILVLKVWTDDPRNRLVAAQEELQQLVSAEFP